MDVAGVIYSYLHDKGVYLAQQHAVLHRWDQSETDNETWNFS